MAIDKFTFGSAGEIQEVEFALARGGFTHPLLKRATSGDFFRLIRDVLEGRAEICRIERLPVEGAADAAVTQHIINCDAKPFEPVLDFLVRVDRSVKPSYPDWFKKLEHPELECSGPAEYDLQTAVQQWLHDDQKNGVVVGNTIYKHLKKDNALVSCLNLQDGLAIQQKGIAVFRKLFAGKAVFLWGSVVQDRLGSLNVPYLCKGGGKVVVDWNWLDVDWSSSNPALRFSK